jgi:hypothetical protein
MIKFNHVSEKGLYELGLDKSFVFFEGANRGIQK